MEVNHYQSGKIETIDKIEKVLSCMAGKISPMQGALIAKALKYVDRMGLKDDPDKEAYKAADYIHRLLTGKWLEKSTTNKEKKNEIN